MRQKSIMKASSFYFVLLLTNSITCISGGSIFLPEKPDQVPEQRLAELRAKDDKQFSSECLATSMVELIIPDEDVYSDPWILQSYDHRGRKKNRGGDEYYISFVDDAYKDPSERNFTSVAHVTDLHNGRYALDFITGRWLNSSIPLHNRGELTIFLQYTCDIGKIWPPGKNLWESNGAMYRTYSTRLDIPPPQRDPRPLQLEKNLKDYDVVLALGDSVMVQLFCIKMRMRRHNMYLHKNIGSTLDHEALIKHADWLRHEAYPIVKNIPKTALLINSGAWDIAKNNDGQESFEDHLITLRRLVIFIRRLMPDVDIIWRSTTAMHVHRGPDLERLRYISQSRVKALNDAQIALMNELNIPVLNVYDYTYELAWWTKPNDAIHYYDWISTQMLDELYPYDERDANVQVVDNHIGVKCEEGYSELRNKRSVPLRFRKK